ncbi:MAG: hypothetical protein DBY10_03350 [Clostridiales bacterium]|jgi:hypothetical protein|nr:MAG: hypothetical protein DBY10_03350 [Clostridiales bacterium]
MTAYLLPRDAQQVPPVCHCALCGGELYRDDLLYLIDEQVLCPDCLGAFAAEYFRHRRFTAGELRESPQL